MLESPAEGWKKVHSYAELSHLKASLMTQMVKKLLALQETWVQSLGWEDPLEAGMATYSSIPAWRIPWTEEPGGLQSMESQSDMTEWLSTVHSTSHLKHFFWMLNGASLVAQIVKRLPAVWETRVRFLGWEDTLEKEMATHSSTLAWKIPWTEEPGRLQFMGSQRVRHDWVTSLSLSLNGAQKTNPSLTFPSNYCIVCYNRRGWQEFPAPHLLTPYDNVLCSFTFLWIFITKATFSILCCFFKKNILAILISLSSKIQKIEFFQFSFHLNQILTLHQIVLIKIETC